MAKVEPRSSGRDRRSSAPAPLRPRQSLGGERRRSVTRSGGPPARGRAPGAGPSPGSAPAAMRHGPAPGRQPAVGTARARGPTGARGALPSPPPSRPPLGSRVPAGRGAAASGVRRRRRRRRFHRAPAFGREPGGRAAFIPDANSIPAGKRARLFCPPQTLRIPREGFPPE